MNALMHLPFSINAINFSTRLAIVSFSMSVVLHKVGLFSCDLRKTTELTVRSKTKCLTVVTYGGYFNTDVRYVTCNPTDYLHTMLY